MTDNPLDNIPTHKMPDVKRVPLTSETTKKPDRCPQCGMPAKSGLACELCGYIFGLAER
jgi:hypothetical protein